MRKLLLLASAIAAIAAATALPAGAATPATFTLTAGALSISAPTGSVSLGSQVGLEQFEHDHRPARRRHRLRPARRRDDLDGIGDLDRVHSSCRPGRPGQQRQLCGGHDHGVRRPWSRRRLPRSNLTGVTTVVTGASAGISSASWNPTISVFVPANFAPGVYSATITHSVA